MADVNWFESNGVSKALGSSEPNEVDYHELGWNELREYAKEMGIDLSKNKSKQDILDALGVL